MPAGAGHTLHQEPAQLVAQQRQLRPLQFFYILRGRDPFQDQEITSLFMSGKNVKHPAYNLQHRRALLNGKGLSHSLSADGQPRHQGRHSQGRPTDAKLKVSCSRRTITAAVVPLTMPQMSPTTSLQKLETWLARRISRSASRAPGTFRAAMEWKGRSSEAVTATPTISKAIAQQDKEGQHTAGQNQPGTLQHLAGKQAQHRRDRNGQEEYLHRPGSSPPSGLLCRTSPTAVPLQKIVPFPLNIYTANIRPLPGDGYGSSICAKRRRQAE